MKKLNRNIMYSAVSMGANFLLPLLALPFLSNALGAHAFGLFAIAQAITIFLVSIVDFGFILVASREVASAKNNSEISKIYSKIQNTRLALACFTLLVILILFVLEIPHTQGNLFLAISVPAIIGAVFQATWLFHGKSFFGWLAISNIISKICFLIIVVFFIKYEDDLLYAGLAFGFTYLIGGAILLYATVKIGIVWRFQISITEYKKTLTSSLRSFLSLSLLGFHTQIVIALTGSFVGPAAAGLLLITDRVIRSVSALGIPLANALFPVLSEKNNTKQSDSEKLRRFALITLLSLAVVGAGAIYIAADYIASIMLPKAADDLSLLLRIAAPTPIFIAIGVVYGGLTLVPTGNDKPYFQSILFAEIISISGFIIFLKMAPFYSGVAAIIMAEVSLAILMFISVYVYITKIKRNSNV
jgi:O-antigen/teichoic acid export membrane protein